MIDEYLRQMLVSDYKDPTYTVIISSLDINEECDHESITVGLTQYNPSIYDLFKAFYINIMGLTPTNELTLKEINDAAADVVDQFFETITLNERKLILRSGLEYDNEQKMYRSVLNANIVDGLATSTTREKTVIISDDSDVFVFTKSDNIFVPIYLKTDYNTALDEQILMITLMDKNRNNIFDNKIVLVTDKKGCAIYYPTALPTYEDEQNYDSYEDEFYNDGIPRYLYYMKVDYPGTEQYEPFSKEFKIYISKGRKTEGNI